MSTPLLSVRDLHTVFDTDAGLARAVDGVSFEVGKGESVGLVGESGCGKSVTAFSILRLIRPPGRITPESHIALDGTDLMALDDESLRQIRGNRVSMIFQEPMTALNPVLRIGDQIAEVLRVHGKTRAPSTCCDWSGWRIRQ
jgi:peptide/nickel transport system ATP-binding protein